MICEHLYFSLFISCPVCLVSFHLAHRRQNILAALRLLSAVLSDYIRHLRGKLKRHFSLFKKQKPTTFSKKMVGFFNSSSLPLGRNAVRFSTAFCQQFGIFTRPS
jgi:hypothetical protein